jgi:hypothetical protein
MHGLQAAARAKGGGLSHTAHRHLAHQHTPGERARLRTRQPAARMPQQTVLEPAAPQAALTAAPRDSTLAIVGACVGLWVVSAGVAALTGVALSLAGGEQRHAKACGQGRARACKVIGGIAEAGTCSRADPVWLTKSQRARPTPLHNQPPWGPHPFLSAAGDTRYRPGGPSAGSWEPNWAGSATDDIDPLFLPVELQLAPAEAGLAPQPHAPGAAAAAPGLDAAAARRSAAQAAGELGAGSLSILGRVEG